MIRVSFDSYGIPLVGHLYPAEEKEGPAPGIVIIGPETFCKEQAPTEYARRLAKRGFAALVFDPRYRGESGGEPRCWENPIAKVEDIRSAVTFLASRPEVVPDRIAGLAICQGSSEMLRAAADDGRIKVLATVAGHYRDREGNLAWLTFSGHTERVAGGERAWAKYRTTGEVEYVPGVDETGTDAGMPGRFVWEWYQPWADRGIWENRYAVMSDADLLSYESLSAAARLETPWLMIHSDNCFLPPAAKRHFEAVPAGTEKKLLWEGQTQHLDYYDQPKVIDPAARNVADWFSAHLGWRTSQQSLPE